MFGEICDNPVRSFLQGSPFSQRISYVYNLLFTFGAPTGLLFLTFILIISQKSNVCETRIKTFRGRASQMACQRVQLMRRGERWEGWTEQMFGCGRFQLQQGVKQKYLNMIYIQHSFALPLLSCFLSSSTLLLFPISSHLCFPLLLSSPALVMIDSHFLLLFPFFFSSLFVSIIFFLLLFLWCLWLHRALSEFCLYFLILFVVQNKIVRLLHQLHIIVF